MIDPHLRKQLLAIETETPSLKEKYEKEIETMIEKELTSHKKMELYAEIGIGTFILFGGLLIALLFFNEHSFFMTCTLILMSLFGLSGVIHGSWILHQGKINIKHYVYLEMAILWSFGLLIFISCIYNGALSENPAEGVLKVLYGFPILFFLLLATLHRFMERNNLELKEHLLRMELQMLELDKKSNAILEKCSKE